MPQLPTTTGSSSTGSSSIGATTSGTPTGATAGATTGATAARPPAPTWVLYLGVVLLVLALVLTVWGPRTIAPAPGRALPVSVAPAGSGN